MATTLSSADQKTLTVAQLTAQIKRVVEGEFPSVWVAGEVSNFSRPQSGHCYFTLKDEQAQIRAVIWRSTAARLKFDLSDGMELICHGHLDVYAPRGSYQLVLDQVQPKGVGALELALRKLRDKLAAEGLFERSRKKPLPSFPRQVALVTSPTGAAVQDFLEVLRQRWRGVHVLVLPVRVQGDGAAEEIAEAIRTANRLSSKPDVLVVGRGGGSLEDLWAFNEEKVVRAIARSTIPTVSAVGHEIDVTLSDLAADVRALTPSDAALKVVPSAEEMVARIGGFQQRLLGGVRRYVAVARTRLDAAGNARALRRPFDIVHDRSRRLDELEVRAGRAAHRAAGLRRNALGRLEGKIESLSPLAVLQRGYSITQDASSGQLVRDAQALRVGQSIVTRFASGQATSTVEDLDDSEN